MVSRRSASTLLSNQQIELMSSTTLKWMRSTNTSSWLVRWTFLAWVLTSQEVQLLSYSNHPFQRVKKTSPSVGSIDVVRDMRPEPIDTSSTTHSPKLEFSKLKPTETLSTTRQWVYLQNMVTIGYRTKSSRSIFDLSLRIPRVAKIFYWR